MTAFNRQPSRDVVARAKGVPIVVEDFVGSREIARAMAAADPFGIDDPCRFAPNGRHYAIGSCGEVACCYCAKTFWK